jgi:hypothetical protein
MFTKILSSRDLTGHIIIEINDVNMQVTVQEFNNLTTDEKAWHLWHGATFLHVYIADDYRVNLFHLDNYYIELWYSIKGNKVDHIRAFKSVELLAPFLDNINIHSIIKT